MTQVPASSHGVSAAGGTFTGPVVIDLSADTSDRTALDVIQPSTFGFGVRPFRFRQTDFAYFQMETTGNISTAGNGLATGGGSVFTQGGTLLVSNGAGLSQHVFEPSGPTAGLFGAAAVGKQALIASPAGGVVQDAEARTAISALINTLRNLGISSSS